MTAQARPALLTCTGSGHGSELLAVLAAELARLGVGEPAGLSDPLDAGREVVVLDGCASACGSRLLAGRGANVVAALTLTELGVEDAPVSDVDVHALAERAVQAIGAGAGRPSRPSRPQRPERQAPRVDGRAHTTEDYLLAIDGLSSPVVECGVVVSGTPTLASHVSDALGVSRPTAGEMLAKLEASGLVLRNDRKELLLTDRGRAVVDRTLRRQRLLEVFAVDVLGYDAAAAWEQARALRDAFDDDAAERLFRSLGSPARCPHGWPLDAAQARAERGTLRTLDALADGECGTVTGVAEGDADVLRRLALLGIAPGTHVRAGDVDERDARAVFVSGAAAGGPPAAASS